MLNLFAVTLVYAGLAAAALGLISVAKPLRFLGVRSRKSGAAIAGGGAALVAAGMLMPAPLERVDAPATDLDRVMPAWQFREAHRTHVDASAERAYGAVRAVTADEIALFR